MESLLLDEVSLGRNNVGGSNPPLHIEKIGA